MTPEANTDILFDPSKARPAAKDIKESNRWVDIAQFVAAKRIASQAHDLGDLSVNLRHGLKVASIAYYLAHLDGQSDIHTIYGFRYVTSAGFTLGFHYMFDCGKEADLVVNKNPEGDDSFEVRKIFDEGTYGDQIFVSKPLVIKNDRNIWRWQNIDKLTNLIKREIDPEKDDPVVSRSRV